MSKFIPRRFLGAFKMGHRVSAREYIDDELSYSLLAKGDAKSFEALEWLSKFNNEYYRAVLTKTEDLLHSKKYHKEINDRANARRRDVMTVCSHARVHSGHERFLSSLLDKGRITNNLEDLFIDVIDTTKDLTMTEPAQELVEKVNALKTLTLMHRLLNEGSFVFHLGVGVPHCIKFVESLHANMKAECLSHADSDLIPDLVEIKSRETEVVSEQA